MEQELPDKPDLRPTLFSEEHTSYYELYYMRQNIFHFFSLTKAVTVK
jgi:hypothetical protein